MLEHGAALYQPNHRRHRLANRLVQGERTRINQPLAWLIVLLYGFVVVVHEQLHPRPTPSSGSSVVICSGTRITPVMGPRVGLPPMPF
jgi:hypothetical protein